MQLPLAWKQFSKLKDVHDLTEWRDEGSWREDRGCRVSKRWTDSLVVVTSQFGNSTQQEKVLRRRSACWNLSVKLWEAGKARLRSEHTGKPFSLMLWRKSSGHHSMHGSLENLQTRVRDELTRLQTDGDVKPQASWTLGGGMRSPVSRALLTRNRREATRRLFRTRTGLARRSSNVQYSKEQS